MASFSTKSIHCILELTCQVKLTQTFYHEYILAARLHYFFVFSSLSHMTTYVIGNGFGDKTLSAILKGQFGSVVK